MGDAYIMMQYALKTAFGPKLGAHIAILAGMRISQIWEVDKKNLGREIE